MLKKPNENWEIKELEIAGLLHSFILIKINKVGLTLDYLKWHEKLHSTILQFKELCSEALHTKLL